MRLLVLTDDRVGPAMAGSALRAWELARCLRSAGHNVCLAAAGGSTSPGDDGPELVPRPPWRWAEAVLAPPWSLPPRAFLGRRRLLVVDGATPLLAELAAMPQRPDVVRRRRTAAARLPLALARADAVLAAGQAQAAWWRTRLARVERNAPVLEVPFGIPDEDPSPERDEVTGIPTDWAIVLWWGGVWPWQDLDTLLAARARLGAAPLTILVPTAARPGGSALPFTSQDLAAVAERHGLRHPQVAALEEWIPYQERHRLLNRTTLIAVLHHGGREAELSFRTRALDGVWAGVPMLVSEGGEVARLVRTNGWGGVLPLHDPDATAAALDVLAGEREQLRCRRALAQTRDQWRWSKLVQPLLAFLERPPKGARGSLLGAAARAAVTLVGWRKGADA